MFLYISFMGKNQRILKCFMKPILSLHIVEGGGPQSEEKALQECHL
jgi:hypothetical protein